MQKLPIFLIGGGFAVAVLAVILGFVVAPKVISSQVNKQVQLVNGTETFEKWQDLPLPVYLMFYIFNVTNPKEVERGAKPILREAGPYSYREKRTKVNISISDDQEFITYRQKIDYFFDPSRSEGSEDDLVNIINIPYVAVASKLDGLHFALKYPILKYIEYFEETVFIRKRVREILFDGYQQHLMKSIEKLMGKELLINGSFGLFHGTVASMVYPMSTQLADLIIKTLRTVSLGSESLIRTNVRVGDLIFDGFPVPYYDIPLKILSQLAPTLNITVPELPPEFADGRFGAYRGKNGSDDGLWEIHSGVKNRSLFGVVNRWDNKTELDFWVKSPGNYCNKLNGSDGSLFPPFVKKETVLRLFNPDLCRSLYLTFEEETEFMGVSAYRFAAPKSMLEDPRVNHDNLCFCPKPGKDYEGCLKSGAIQLSACRDGAPVAMSTPHFYDSEIEYLDQSYGLRPVKEKHVTYIDIEPLSGLPLRAHKRIQINVELKNLSGIAAFEKVPEMLFPVLWADEFAELDDELADELKSRLITPLKIVGAAKWALLGIGLLVMVSGIAVYVFRMRQKKYYS